MKYQLIAIDIDGTITGPDRLVTERLRSAVAGVRQQGVVVTIATGRMFRSARRFAGELGLDGPIISYQGAMTGHARTGEIMRHVGLDPAVARQALSLLRGRSDMPPPGQLHVYIDDEIYALGVNEWAYAYQQRMGVRINVVDSLFELADSSPTLILAVDEPADTEVRAGRLRRELDGVARITRSLPNFCEVAAPEAGKVNGLNALADSLGIDRRSVVAIGDGPGDAEMLAWAGLGVAIDGGHAEALAAADRVVAGPDKDGVAGLLEELAAGGP